MNKIKRILLLWTAFAIVALSACGTAQEEDSRLTVAVSIPPLSTIVRAIAGDQVEIVTLIPPGNSPENYEPTPNILRKLEDSSLYFSLGVPAEEANIKPKAPQLNKDLIVVNLYEYSNEAYPDLLVEGERDPHLWLSIKRVKVMTNIIAQQLSEVDPDNAKIYSDNAESFQTLLDETDCSIREKLKNLKSKEFLIYHPALGYFADEYQLNMIAVEEHGKEASIKQLGEITDYAKEKGIKTVFYQAEHDKKQAEIVAAEIGGKTQMIDPLSADFPQSLSDIADAMLESEGK